MKRIWLINQYAMPPDLEPRLRTIKFAQYLTQKGYDVTIFASSIMHNMHFNLIEDNSLYIEKNYGTIKFVHINTKPYVKNGINRIISSIQFSSRLHRIASKFAKPDVIVHTATVPFGNSFYYLAKNFNSKYIVEILDLWPLSFVDLGIINKRNPILYFAYWAERWLYEKADNVVFSMEGGINYIKDKGWDIESGGKIDPEKIHYINNGVDLEDFDFNVKNHKLDDNDLSDNNIKKVIYIGSIRLANNLIKLIEAARLMKNHTDIKFLFYGDGDERVHLQEFCKKNDINNVVFKEKWINPKYVPYLLSCSTLNILNYMPGHFGNYGGSQSKMFQYMASAKPICTNLEMMYCPIKLFNLGISKEFKTSEEYAAAILQLVNMDKDKYNQICEVARKTAENFDYKHLTDKMEELFLDKEVNDSKIKIENIEKSDIDDVVSIHCASFKSFFLTELGPEFLKVYYNAFRKSKRGVMLGCFDDGKLVGFCCASYKSSGFNTRLVIDNSFSFLIETFKLIFKKFDALIRIFNNLKKGHASFPDVSHYAELYSIAVLPTKQGLGIGKFLIENLEIKLKEKSKKISLTTDFDSNQKTLQFYNTMGYDILYDFVAHPQRKMYRLIKTLDK